MSNCPPDGPHFSKTKIVATLGPASANPTMIEALLVAGVDVFRLNMAHGTPREQAPRLSMIRDVSRQVGQPVAVLADLAGVDRDNALWAGQVGVDFVGLGLVRRAGEVRQFKELLATQGTAPQVIAKIETPEALADLAAIVAAADGVMVVRGDLGVETDIARVALAQKQIVAVCRRACKPVIVATQMLDSMQHSRLPTRAEVSDVANAILDGADACMLSGETAIGEYPREAVQMMHRIALAAEGWDGPLPPLQGEGHVETVSPIRQSIVRAAGQIAEEVRAKLVVVATASGATALALAKLHYRVPTLGISNSAATLRRICLYYGVIPLPGVPMDDSPKTLQFITDWGRRNSCLTSGDHLVMISGAGLPTSAHNQIVLHRVP